MVFIKNNDLFTLTGNTRLAFLYLLFDLWSPILLQSNIQNISGGKRIKISQPLVTDHLYKALITVLQIIHRIIQ